MSIFKGGTITLRDKTYNISQINSVYTGMVPRYGTAMAFALWVIGGIIGLFILGAALSQGTGDNAALMIWVIVTMAASVCCLAIGSAMDHAVFFDMSSGKVSAYVDPDRNKVELIRDDIVKGLEAGYFPNYLQGRASDQGRSSS